MYGRQLSNQGFHLDEDLDSPFFLEELSLFILLPRLGFYWLRSFNSTCQIIPVMNDICATPGSVISSEIIWCVCLSCPNYSHEHAFCKQLSAKNLHYLLYSIQ